MIVTIVKKLNVFQHFPCFNVLRTETRTETVDGNNSLFISVPISFYIDFIKEHYKSFLLCFLSIFVVITAPLCAPYYFNIQKKNTSHTTSEVLKNNQIINSKYIQLYNPSAYEEMLQILRRMQQASFYLQVKQQASDRKTQALQQQIQKLQVTTNDKAEIINEEKAQKMIKEALTVYDADKLGLRDYALESVGGTILSTPLTSPKLSQKDYVLLGFFRFSSYSNPRTLIQPEVHPGNCFAFEGSYGRIRIRLSNKIFISAVTLEHAPNILLTQDEIMSAPKNFAINGLYDEKSELGYPLGQFIYSIEGPPRQTFLIINPTEINVFEIIELEIISNHGNSEYTCVYRIRVHGRLYDYD